RGYPERGGNAMNPAALTPVVVAIETPVADAPGSPTSVETWLARVMFALAAVFLLLLAGLIHRAQQPQVTALEISGVAFGRAALGRVFAGGALVGTAPRARPRPLRPVPLRAALVALLPPFRMALIDPRTGLIWLPRLGWRPPGKELSVRL